MTPGFGLRVTFVSGVVWGVVVALAITLNQPVGDLSLAEWGTFTVDLAMVWGVTGLVWAFGVRHAEQSRRPWLWLTATCLVATFASLVFSYGQVKLGGEVGFAELLDHMPLDGQSAYNLWANLIYGGLYAAGYFATRRTLRLRARLSELTVARSDAESALREARLAAVRGQVQPALLLEALDALRGAYAQSTTAGEALFDRIIAFLRAAMPGLRTGASTLSAELAVVRRYRDLEAALPAGRPVWRLDLADPPPDLVFPPLRLLPALDRVSRALPAGATVALVAAPAEDGFVMRIGVDAADALPPETLRRLRAGLRRDLGPRLAATTGAMLAELRMPLAA